jgi:hypothetical protein
MARWLTKKMELTTKAEPILGEFKDLGRLLWQLILDVMLSSKLAEDPGRDPGDEC